LFCRRKGIPYQGHEWFRKLLFEDVVTYLKQQHEIKKKPKIKRKSLPPDFGNQLELNVKSSINWLEYSESAIRARILKEYRMTHYPDSFD